MVATQQDTSASKSFCVLLFGDTVSIHNEQFLCPAEFKKERNLFSVFSIYFTWPHTVVSQL